MPDSPSVCLGAAKFTYSIKNKAGRLYIFNTFPPRRRLDNYEVLYLLLKYSVFKNLQSKYTVKPP